MALVAPNKQWVDGRLKPTDEKSLRFYRVNSSLLFEHLAGDYLQCERAMQEIIDRYNIRGRKVLGVGPGNCMQEYWFARNDNALILVDIDEKGLIETALQSLHSVSNATEPTITYAIGDARRTAEYLDNPFDVVFLSGFTPDEYHRATIIDASRTLNTEHAPDTGVWPLSRPPFSELCIDLARRLPNGGLFISLSYASGPDVKTSRFYLPAMQAQLRANGLELLEVYFLREIPGVHLAIAVKEQESAALKEIVNTLKKQPPITRIHPCAHNAHELHTITAFSKAIRSRSSIRVVDSRLLLRRVLRPLRKTKLYGLLRLLEQRLF